jgi:tetratricopeptide (TPR) repeat protein
MNKPSRNDPCPCGSGLKYKKCCAGKDAATESQRLAANKARIEAQETKYRQQLKETAELHRAQLDGQWDEEDSLTQESNAVLDLINAGQLEEAESGARQLLARYPETNDGYLRLGHVFEARGDRPQAAHCYRQAAQFMREHSEWYDAEYIEATEQRVRDMEA